MRTLDEEIGRVVRARVVNPKWIEGVMRHGYKGAFEMAATVDYMFAFAATTGSVADHHFDAVFDAYVADDCRARLHAGAQPGRRPRAGRAPARSPGQRLVAPEVELEPRAPARLGRRRLISSFHDGIGGQSRRHTRAQAN